MQVMDMVQFSSEFQISLHSVLKSQRHFYLKFRINLAFFVMYWRMALDDYDILNHFNTLVIQLCTWNLGANTTSLQDQSQGRNCARFGIPISFVRQTS